MNRFSWASTNEREKERQQSGKFEMLKKTKRNAKNRCECKQNEREKSKRKKKKKNKEQSFSTRELIQTRFSHSWILIIAYRKMSFLLNFLSRGQNIEQKLRLSRDGKMNFKEEKEEDDNDETLFFTLSLDVQVHDVVQQPFCCSTNEKYSFWFGVVFLSSTLSFCLFIVIRFSGELTKNYRKTQAKKATKQLKWLFTGGKS